ncbi:outer membrane protein assembly factor BamE [Teredinibacter purpureus]|uniref:outer membrane protein assembly factor BamE n=1 Tax=Teredinibacter purpureus TaxID=2731756 RepID=UPI0005F78A58|nr:outer membrane protein assembly factor BamE [Teredinibacter purpureus]
MQFVLKTVLLIVVLFAATGCSRLQFPWVYRIYIQQGNHIDAEKVEQLEVGMTPEQVRFLMGNPLIADTFNADRWDYYFTMIRGEDQLSEYHFTVYFENGLLERWEGDYKKKRKPKPIEKPEDTAGDEDDTPVDINAEGAPLPVESTPAT